MKEKYVLLYGIKCSGSETSIQKCQNMDWVSKPCTSGYIVVLMCSNETIRDTGFSLEILRGDDASEEKYHGAIKVTIGGLYGSICNNTWGKEEATVACRQLNFTGGVALPYTSIHYRIRQNWMSTLMHSVRCKGTEKSIDKCKYEKWGDKDKCPLSLGQAAYVVCYKSELKFRISGGGADRGRVEIIRDGVVGTVCDEGWNRKAAKVFCKRMKFTEGYALSKSHDGHGTGKVWLTSLNCNGLENSILDCANSGWDRLGNVPSSTSPTSCSSHMRDAYVHCLNEPMAITDVQLVEGDEDIFSGRLEVFVSGALTWGTVCGDDFDDNAALVVCRMKGFRKGHRIPLGSIPVGRGRIWLSKIRCKGTETSIAACQLGELEDNTCDHANDVAVECSEKLIVTSTTKIPSSTTQSKMPPPTTTARPTTTRVRSTSPITFAPKTSKPRSTTTTTAPRSTSPKVYRSTSPNPGFSSSTARQEGKPSDQQHFPLMSIVIPLLIIIIVALLVIIIVTYKWRRAVKGPRHYPVTEPPPVNLHLMAAETNLGEEYPSTPVYDGSMRFSNKLYDMDVDNDMGLGDQEKDKLMQQ